MIEIIRQHADHLILVQQQQQQGKDGENSDQKQQEQQQVLDAKKFFAFYQSIIERFAHDSPFEDISSRFKQLVRLFHCFSIF